MKRILGSVILLAGLTGCVAPSSSAGLGDKTRPGDGKIMAPPEPNGFVAQTPVLPTNTTWTPHPDHQLLIGPGGNALASRSGPYGPVLTSTSAQMSGLAPAGSAGSGIVRAAADLPPSLVPVVTTPGAVTRPAAGVAAPALTPFPSGLAATEMPGSPGKDQIITPVSATQAADPLTAAALPPPSSPPATPSERAIDMKAAAEPKARGAAEGKITKATMPLIRMVNTRRIRLNFEVKDVGLSGLANVDLWYTQNCRDWKKYEAPKTSKAYVVEVNEEGMYGFTLVARSGLGLGKEPPTSGDQPQVWVIVDLTPPEVQLTDVSPSPDSKQQKVTIGWKASDKNFSRAPIMLSYAETEAGPWRVIASNLENTGKYTWQMPSAAPSRFIVRVEATDLAGNVSRAQSPRAILLDYNTPTVSITNVEPNMGH